MLVLDLFCGTKSIAKAFEERGHTVFTVDWNENFNPSLVADIGKLTAADIIKLCDGVPEVIWASPDCTTYSVAAISKHRRKEQNGNLTPISEYAKQCDETNKHLINLIRELNPQYWFIENPRAGLRKMDFIQDLPRYTVTYCKYGDKRMKPTDIWTNHPNPEFFAPCKMGDSCHEAAPRGSQTGTQGLASKIEKAKIPEKLCEHIVEICEKRSCKTMENKHLKIVTLSIDELTPYKNNAKLHPREQIEQIKESITENGFNDPIAVWGENNIIVEGHGRLIACKELGFTEVDCIRLDHLTEEQRRAYTLSHNKLTMNSGFDSELLDLEVEELQDLGVDVIGFSFNDEAQEIDIDGFFEDAEPKEEKEPKKIQCPHCGEWFEV